MVNGSGSCLISGELSGSRLIRFELGRSARAALHAMQFLFTLPWGQGVHTAELRFAFPLGQGLHFAQLLFKLPWGQGVHSTQLRFTLPCEHRFFPIVRALRHSAHTLLRTPETIRLVSWLRLFPFFLSTLMKTALRPATLPRTRRYVRRTFVSTRCPPRS